MSVRRRIGWAAAAIFGPLAVAAVAAPYLVDVESYKPSLIQAVKEATGRELVIDGPMKLSVFPVPRISAQQVHFANAAGATGAQMVDVRWIGASPSWLALLQGRVEVGTVTLYQPTIVLETDANGVPNWQFKPGAGAAQPQGAPADGFHLAVGELRIVQGTISYTNPQTGQTLKAEQVAATASVGSLNGPFSISGSATVNGVPLSLDFNLSEPKAAGHDTAFSLTVLSGKLDFKGTVSEVSANAEVKGHLAVSTGALTDFIAAVVRASGQAPPKFDSSVVGNFTFDGDIEYTPTRLAVTDFKMSMGGETATGTLALEEGKTPSLKGHVALAKIDLEKWLALLAVPGAFQSSTPPAVTPAAAPAAQAAKPTAAPAAKPAPAAQDAKPAPAARPPSRRPAAKPAARPKSNSLSPFPTEMDVSLSLAIAEVLYRKGTVRDLAVALEIHKGVITVPQLKAVLPGDMVLQANAAAPTAPAARRPSPRTPPAPPAAGAVQATGDFSLAGPKLRDTLAWLGIDTSGVPADKLQKLDLKGKLASTAGGLQIAGLTVDLDGQQATGSGGVAFSLPLTATATLQLDRFDLDAYMPPEQPAAPIAPTHRRGEGCDRHARHRPAGDARAAGAAAARQDRAGLRPQGQGGQAGVPQGDAERHRGRRLGAGQPVEAQHRQGRRPAGRQDGRPGLGDRFRHRAALRSHLQCHHAGCRQGDRLRRPAEIHQRQDRRGLGRRRRGRHDGRHRAAQRHRDLAGQHAAGHRHAGARPEFPLRLLELRPARRRTRAGSWRWRRAARRPAPARSPPTAPSRATSST